MVFVHGGAFVRGDKSQPGGTYDNFLYWFARQGMVGVNVEYRLGDKAPYPGGGEDVRDAVAWSRSAARGFALRYVNVGGGLGADPRGARIDLAALAEGLEQRGWRLHG